MKAKSNKIVISFITSLLLLSSISVLAPTIIHYNSSANKSSILLSTVNNYTPGKLLNNNYSNTVNTLINNLTYINKYINLTLIIKEKRLRLSILGGLYDKSAKYKNDKKKKRSELSLFSHSIKHVHRYGDQVQATIDNSTSSLSKESGVISQVIKIINEHPFTYNFYLNKLKISIPDISFFLGQNNLSNSNNLNSKTSDISNSSYGISRNDANLNSISFYSEEAGVNAQALYSGGSSVWKAAFKKITFQAQIITFDKTSNSFRYETPTSKEDITSKTLTNTKFDSKNIEISNVNTLKTNNSLYFHSNKTELSILNLLNNTFKQNLPTPLIPNYLPGYFNTQLLNAAEARVKYNHISLFKHNNSLYYPLIFSPVVITGVSIGSIAAIFKYKKWKKQQRCKKDLNHRLQELQTEIETPKLPTTSDYDFVRYVKEIEKRITLLRIDTDASKLKRSTINKILTRIDNAVENYNNKTLARKTELGLIIIQTPSVTNPDDLEINDELVKDQLRNKNEVKNIITKYVQERNDIYDEINTTDTHDNLDIYNYAVASPYQSALNKLKNADYVSSDDVYTLETELNDILIEIKNRYTVRWNVIKADNDAAEQKIRDEAIALKEANKQVLQAAIEARRREIDSLDNPNINTEWNLDNNVEQIQKKITNNVNDIRKKEYEHDDVVELNRQITKLEELLNDKIDSTRRRIRDNNRVITQELIDNHEVSISQLDKADTEEKVEDVTKKLKKNIADIRKKISESNYNDEETFQQLTNGVDALDTILDIKIGEVIQIIEHWRYFRIALQYIEHSFNEIEQYLTESTVHLRDIKDTEDLVLLLESKIKSVVEKAKIYYDDFSYEELKGIDAKVKDFRNHYKQMYESNKVQFKKENDDTKASLNNELTKKQEELKNANYIMENTKPKGDNAKKYTTAEKTEASDKAKTLEINISKLKIQLKDSSVEETKQPLFIFPEEVVNIFDI